MQLIMPSPFPVYKCAEKTHTQPVSAKPDEVNYRGYAMENYISKKNAQSFLSRGWEHIVKRLRVIRDLRYFRRPKATPKPDGIANLDRTSHAAYRTPWLDKIKLVTLITRRFVKDFESNYPEIWPKLKPCEKNHLAKIIKKPSERILLDLTQQKISREHPIYGHGDGMRIPDFSAAFLEAMRSLESKIAASLYDLPAFTLEVTEPKREEAFKLEMPKQEQLSESKRQSEHAALWSVDVKPQLSDDERSASKPIPYDAFQNARMSRLDHFRKLAMNDLEVHTKDPDELTRAIMQSIEEFDKHYSTDFVSRLDRSRDNPHKYTSTDLWDAHNFAMGKAIESCVKSAVSSNAISSDSVSEYKKQLGDMCLQINRAIACETNILKPVIAY